MAQYSFAPNQLGWGGSLGGYGSLGIGRGINNAMAQGLLLRDAFARAADDAYLSPQQNRAAYTAAEAQVPQNLRDRELAMNALKTATEIAMRQAVSGTAPNRTVTTAGGQVRPPFNATAQRSVLTPNNGAQNSWVVAGMRPGDMILGSAGMITPRAAGLAPARSVVVDPNSEQYWR